MKINKHQIINIQVSQGKFYVINKLCHTEVNQTYPTCGLTKFIFKGNIFLAIYGEFWGQWETEIYPYGIRIWAYFISVSN